MTILLEVLACSLYLTDIYSQSIFIASSDSEMDSASVTATAVVPTSFVWLFYFTILRRSFLQSAMGARKSSNTFSIGILFFGYMLYLLYIYVYTFIYIYIYLYIYIFIYL